LLGVGFLVCGLLMISSLKRYFTEFYIKVSCILWCATLVLAIPMFIRAVNWSTLELNDNYNTYYMDNIAYTDALNLLLTTIIPVVAQMSSMIFGHFKRMKQQDQKERKYSVGGTRLKASNYSPMQNFESD